MLYGLWAANFLAARLEPALGLARQFSEVAERQENTTYRPVGYRLIATVHAFIGQNREAMENVQRAEQYRDPDRRKVPTYRFGVDPDLPVLCREGIGPAVPRPPRSGGANSEQLREELPTTTCAHCRCVHLLRRGVAGLLSGDLEACERHSDELIAYCEEKKGGACRLWRRRHACARASRDPTEENIAALRAAIDAADRSGVRLLNSNFLSNLAEALLAADNVRGAEATLQEAFAFVERSGERFWLADLHRLEGQIALKRPEPDPERAEACSQSHRHRP